MKITDPIYLDPNSIVEAIEDYRTNIQCSLNDLNPRIARQWMLTLDKMTELAVYEYNSTYNFFELLDIANRHSDIQANWLAKNGKI